MATAGPVPNPNPNPENDHLERRQRINRLMRRTMAITFVGTVALTAASAGTTALSLSFLASAVISSALVSACVGLIATAITAGPVARMPRPVVFSPFAFFRPRPRIVVAQRPLRAGPTVVHTSTRPSGIHIPPATRTFTQNHTATRRRTNANQPSRVTAHRTVRRGHPV